jgi:hypothetical protein
MTNKDDWLSEREELLKEISSYPWKIYNDYDPESVDGIVSSKGRTIVETDSGYYPPNLIDAKFIATSPEFEAKAIKRIRELEAELASVTNADKFLSAFECNKQNQIMREALEYYATQNGWESVRIMDGGEKAREALKKVDNDQIRDVRQGNT